MCEYDIYRIMDLVESIGEDSVRDIFSDFSCEYRDGIKNDEIEIFLRKSAIEFSKRKMSITYLVTDKESRMVGYFTLTHKPITICDAALNSKANKKRMMRHATFDERLDAYSVSAFLIAQFSKNYSIPPDERISGSDLMDLTLSLIDDVQRQIGGGVVFLECENHPELLDFYSGMPHSFFRFGERFSEKDGVKYQQMMRFL
ncbi:MAG: GNAT family acetyltransferase [Lachnospiraceae bacterium]|nr:GNAT family acetyltransferase [Lachnospiraceae bacterium]